LLPTTAQPPVLLTFTGHAAPQISLAIAEFYKNANKKSKKIMQTHPGCVAHRAFVSLCPI
jgi:hypothetical protein